MSACGGPLQPRGYGPHPAGSLLLRVREEPGKLLSGVTRHQRHTNESSGGATVTRDWSYFSNVGLQKCLVCF